MQSGRTTIGIGAAAMIAAGLCAGGVHGQVELASAGFEPVAMGSDVASWLATGGGSAMMRRQDFDAPPPSAGGGLGLTFGAVTWVPTADGNISLADAAGFASNIDVQGDLGIDDIASNVIWDVGLRLGRHHFSLSGFSISSSEIEAVLKDLSFGDVTISPGDVVDTDLDLDNLKLLYSYSLFTAEEHGFDFGFSTGVDYFHIDASLENVTTLIQDSFDEHVPLPVLGVRLGVPLGPFHVATDVSGFYLDINDIEASFLDATATLSWQPVPGVSIYGGYRVLLPNLTGNDYEADTALHGPFVGGAIHF